MDNIKNNISPNSNLIGNRNDNHELTRKTQQYATEFLRGEKYPLDDEMMQPSCIYFETSTRAKRRHGAASYDDGAVTIIMSEHTYENADFESCKETIRHELVHAWQYFNKNQLVVFEGDELIEATYEDHITDDDWDRISDQRKYGEKTVVVIETGHGESFKVWVDILDLQGRCSNHYQKTRDQYKYVMSCTNCSDWWGRYRMCNIVRFVATGESLCGACEEPVHLQRPIDNKWFAPLETAHSSLITEKEEQRVKDFFDGCDSYVVSKGDLL